ncbi:MAG TPA: FAD-dependent oxidoreductase [Xanthobacteraceae bacterium]
MSTATRSVAIIGGGPVGLAAAAHALERGLRPLVLEAGPRVGHAVAEWGHVRMFSPWEYNIDGAAGRLLAAVGWNSPDPQQYPIGRELVENYLKPLATSTALRSHIQTASRVTAISRVGFDKVKTKGRELALFEIRYENGAGPKTVRTDAVIDASGSWSSPNSAGANGLPATGESAVRDRIAYGMPDVLGRARARYANKAVAVVGSGHSAVGTLIDLVALKDDAPATEIIWLVRGEQPEKAFGGGVNDKLVERGALGARLAAIVQAGRIRIEAGFRVSHIAREDNRLRVSTAKGSGCCGRQVFADELVVATGFRPDLSFLREIRIALDPALECPSILAPLIDPNEHSCGTVRPHGARELAQPEHGFYLAGMKSYGRAPTFLMLTGYEQVRSIVADIDGDRAAAERLELVLPETGVCNLSPGKAGLNECCGTSSEAEGGADARACCAPTVSASACCT